MTLCFVPGLSLISLSRGYKKALGGTGGCEDSDLFVPFAKQCLIDSQRSLLDMRAKGPPGVFHSCFHPSSFLEGCARVAGATSRVAVAVQIHRGPLDLWKIHCSFSRSQISHI